jgi:hypothetical protein
MLDHIDPPALRDRAFAQAARVLRGGGVFAGTESIGAGWKFGLIHVGDTLALVDPATLPDRLRAAGFADAHVDRNERSLRFRAYKDPEKSA